MVYKHIILSEDEIKELIDVLEDLQGNVGTICGEYCYDNPEDCKIYMKGQEDGEICFYKKEYDTAEKYINELKELIQ